MTMVDGSTREVFMKPLTVCHCSAEGYYGFRDWSHGKWMGSDVVGSEMLNLTNEKDYAEVCPEHDDHICEFQYGDEVGYGGTTPFHLLKGNRYF